MRLLLATHNAKKRSEVARILAEGAEGAKGAIELVTPSEVGLRLEPEETGSTFEKNALIKARAFAARFEGLVLADDSGLEVDALGGAPGVRSARYAGPGATDAQNRARLLKALEGVPPERRTARFVCALALVRGPFVVASIRGACEGRILEAERGLGGFGYDSLFFHPPSGLSFAELDPAEKDRYSHRGTALRRLAESLERIGNGS